MSAGASARKGLVLVDHGSRAPAANAQLEAVAGEIAAARADLIIEIAHMELVQPDLASAIERAIERGASELTILPYFLGPGRHTTEDIPRLAADARARHPDTPIHLAGPLARHPAVTEALLARYDEAQDEIG